MLALYRALLNLYPAAYRCEYGEEMMAVLSEVDSKMGKESMTRRVVQRVHEAGGLLSGALQEHLRSTTGFYLRTVFLPRRFSMRSEFRFPKATVTLMVLILVAVVMAIEKAKAISASLPHTAMQVGPIQPEQFTTVSTLLLALAGACVVGVLGWAILFALRRSGVHRLSDVNPSSQQRSNNRLLI